MFDSDYTPEHANNGRSGFANSRDSNSPLCRAEADDGRLFSIKQRISGVAFSSERGRQQAQRYHIPWQGGQTQYRAGKKYADADSFTFASHFAVNGMFDDAEKTRNIMPLAQYCLHFCRPLDPSWSVEKSQELSRDFGDQPAAKSMMKFNRTKVECEPVSMMRRKRIAEWDVRDVKDRVEWDVCEADEGE